MKLQQITSKLFTACDWLIRLAMIMLCFISYLCYWFITSDIPICIDATELKFFLILNFVRFALNVVIVLNSINKKTSHKIILTVEILFFYLWLWIFKHSNLYAEIKYYQFIIIFSLVCLSLEILSQLYLVLRSKDKWILTQYDGCVVFPKGRIWIWKKTLW